ncbi:hypothetical protein QN277_029198 [Acacia crassicarpa]|uniref:non-specific serine/threonine protein kinase n=1 Tax=Acacia crassicarpa TaxID=499986 RepID=A0AAE1J8E7_9FABA|nr:hypothetical protein QN277_029198 [Acacia crassicarpa]
MWKRPFYIQDMQDPSCGFPFFGLFCTSDGFPQLSLSNTRYNVDEIFYDNQSLRVSNPNLLPSNSTNCLFLSTNLSLDYRYSLAPNQKEVQLLFDCDLPSLPEEIKKNVWGCHEGNRTKSVLGMAVEDDADKLKYAYDKCDGEWKWTMVENLEGGIREALGRGFLLKSPNWTASECNECQSSGGRCGFVHTDGFGFRCFCHDSDHLQRCSSAPERKGKISKVVVGPVSAATIGVFFFLIIYWFVRTLLWKNTSKAHQDFEAFLKNHGSLPTKRYSYSEIKNMTNCFKEKLGQGGYGSVFKGKLYDKCPVTVKVLKETKGNNEEFMNEVASISKTSHVNIVTLLGFCFEGSKRALVYEFMANGSLEKFIFENDANLVEGNLQLSSEILHQIAMGVARGLEYLHRGCNTRIFHFDIKPHNILLDENFYPKISDFGLAKICPRNESVVSMLGARGTIGYLAPEVIYRNFGAVSHKLDVYSFGMMVLEMVGGRKNANVNVDDTSEMYFPHWIYKRLELDEDLALRSIRNEDDKQRIRQMVITSLWCIQTNPAERPMMSKVVEMLEGRVETLQVPPKPYSSSPSRSPCSSSSSTL